MVILYPTHSCNHNIVPPSTSSFSCHHNPCHLSKIPQKISTYYSLTITHAMCTCLILFIQLISIFDTEIRSGKQCLLGFCLEHHGLLSSQKSPAMSPWFRSIGDTPYWIHPPSMMSTMSAMNRMLLLLLLLLLPMSSPSATTTTS